MDGKMIAEKRKEKGLTQDALGAMLGISGKAVSKWERGLSQPDASHVGKLTNCSVYRLSRRQMKRIHG